MEQKTARLTVLIDPTKKAAFEALCSAQDLTPSQVVRQLIREYLERHGVSYANAPGLAAPGRSTESVSDDLAPVHPNPESPKA